MSTLLTIVLPLLSSLGAFMLLRMVLSIFLFLVLPWRSTRAHKRLFMKLGGGLYANAKFPMLKYRDYILQLQRFSLHELNEFDEEADSNTTCRLCNKFTQMEDDIVVLPCNF